MISENDKEISTSSESLAPVENNMKEVEKWVRSHGK